MWDLREGTSKVYQPGDFTLQFSNPTIECEVKVFNATQRVTIENHTTNTSLVVQDDPASGMKVPNYFTWSNLDLRDDDGNPINQLSSSLDFWIDPGWNTIEIHGAERVTFNPRFYFTTL